MQRSNTWRALKELKLEGIGPEMRFLEMLKMVRCGSLEIEEDRLPDKLKPLRLIATTVVFEIQSMPFHLQGLESNGFQLWRLR